ncbi:PAPA-1-domain-containing protein [Aaosphaeria arxii CBS 175.79]|uniref:PAPA-1-domain-containing protein n=1 Tax=Aaosphaeria arxii CBS 175.79 TaxID=1450172 RepID=A0A6A5XW81_9PLEO|nr:PAPA-1-domain-containing protein [Aaosphaeria arxii CBS 175.79]KAF2017183.1 PAPA-1-domain-containing protein [Aaosphaeria arxii CBS 175.79]
MVDRAAKRLRRISHENDSVGGNNKGSAGQFSSPAQTASSTRPRRGTTNKSPQAAHIERSSPEEKRQSIHLTVKSSPNKLRQATSGRVAKSNVTSHNIVSGKRSSRNSRVVREVDSDEDEEEDEEQVDAMDVDEEEEDEDDDEDAEGEEDDEDMDAEGDEEDEMDITPAPRAVTSSKENVRVKPPVILKAPQDSVEAKEMAMDDDDDDDELSELDSDLEDEEQEEDEEDEEDEEEDAEGDDDDAEGEEDDEVPAQNDDDEDEEMDSDDDTPNSLSRSHTPDLSKLTRRQRAMVEEEASDAALMALSNEAQKKKHFTEEENAMRRAEMARRRKNLSEKRNEEEKLDTINRLLKRQPSKRQKKIQEITEDDQENEPEVEKIDPLYVRYIQNANGTSMAIPEEWLQSPAGNVFAGTPAKPSNRPYGRRMVEEVA